MLTLLLTVLSTGRPEGGVGPSRVSKYESSSVKKSSPNASSSENKYKN